MSRPTQAPVAGPDREAGLTLVEMVVSMAVGSVLLVLVTAFTVQQVRTVDYAEKRNTASAQIAGAQDLIAKQARGMVADKALQYPSGSYVEGPVAASAEELGFFSYLQAPSATTVSGTAALTVQEVWVWVETTPTGRRLCHQARVRSRVGIKLDAASPDLTVRANRTCHRLVDGLAGGDAVDPVFSYLANTQDPLRSVPSPSAVQQGGTVVDPRTTPGQFKALQVHLRVNGGTAQRPVVLENTTYTTLMNRLG